MKLVDVDKVKKLLLTIDGDNIRYDLGHPDSNTTSITTDIYKALDSISIEIKEDHMNYIMTIKDCANTDYHEVYRITEDQRRIVEELRSKNWFYDDICITFTAETDKIIDLTKGEEDA